MKTSLKFGISLIVLVITIIVIIILAGSVILSLSTNNPISQASKAAYSSDLNNFKDELELYKLKQYSDANGRYDSALLQADATSVTYNGVVDNSKTINDIITSLGTSTKYNGQFVIVNGELMFQGSDLQQQEWANEIGVETLVLNQSVIVNKPVLASGMTAKKWDGNSWVTISSPDTDTSWYNYTNKEWANAQTDDGSMWVWIPRYEYMITTPHISTEQTISINFLNNLSTITTSGYIVHPAFTFGSIELTGIWVAKFEASGIATAVDVKPGIASLRSITIDSAFTESRNMETNTRYGWGTSGTGIDTHLMKNVEWGSISYLSNSIYGKNLEVTINADSNYYTGGGIGTSYISNIAQSSTGNIYGVYDISGGAFEYTAAYVNNGHANLTTYGNSLYISANQYKDVYTMGDDTQSGNYTANLSKVGDAIYETSLSIAASTSWYEDFSYMPYSLCPFFGRSGGYNSATGAGVFAFSYATGGAGANYGFRPVIAISNSL